MTLYKLRASESNCSTISFLIQGFWITWFYLHVLSCISRCNLSIHAELTACFVPHPAAGETVVILGAVPMCRWNAAGNGIETPHLWKAVSLNMFSLVRLSVPES